MTKALLMVILFFCFTFCCPFAIQSIQKQEEINKYQILTPDSLISYISNKKELINLLGGDPSEWKCSEIGDGNLNYVFIVQGPVGNFVVKQALPYVRLVGESWLLPLSRSYFEYESIKEYSKYASQYLPSLYYRDESMALTIMEFLSPHIILRNGLIKGIKYPHMAEHIGKYIAQTLYHTSDLHLSAASKKEKLIQFGYNHAMCKISEDLLFDDPYYNAPMNHWTAPQLDNRASQFREDLPLKLAAQEMKWRFLTRAEALIHGDLHTGSVMVTEMDTRIIDSEFAFYGPMGFDLGAIFANLFISYFSQEGLSSIPGERDSYAEWILEQIPVIWSTFEQTFKDLWRISREEKLQCGDIYNRHLEENTPELRNCAINHRLKSIWDDAIGFAGIKIIRRILGVAHVADFESITDKDKRALCEQKALIFARKLLLDRQQMTSPEILLNNARYFDF